MGPSPRIPGGDALNRAVLRPGYEFELAAQAILSTTEFHDGGLPLNPSLGRFSCTPIATRGIYFGEPEHALKAPLILAATPLIPKAKRFVRTRNEWTRHSILSGDTVN